MKLQPRLEHKDVKERMESLYENIDCERKTALAYTVLFLQRRLVYAFSLVVLQAYPVWQMALLFLQCILMFTFLVLVRPFNKALTNTVEILNELGILVCAYHLIAYTNFQPDPIIGYNFGISMITVTALVALLNIGSMAYQTFFTLKRGIRTLKQKCSKKTSKYSEQNCQSINITEELEPNINLAQGALQFQSENFLESLNEEETSSIDLYYNRLLRSNRKKYNNKSRHNKQKTALHPATNHQSTLLQTPNSLKTIQHSYNSSLPPEALMMQAYKQQSNVPLFLRKLNPSTEPQKQSQVQDNYFSQIRGFALAQNDKDQIIKSVKQRLDIKMSKFQ